MNLVLFGPPGAGKGTQSSFLIERQGYSHISTGDLLRNAIKEETPLGMAAKTLMDKGQLVPDDVVIGLVKEKVSQAPKADYIFDGFPRTAAQAQALDELLTKVGRPIGKALFLEVPHESLMSRLAGRRTCKNCGAVFHMESKPPRKQGVCDNCGSELLQRPDDREEVIGKRLEAYEQSTAPLKQFYAKLGKFVAVNGLGEVEEVYSRLSKAIKA